MGLVILFLPCFLPFAIWENRSAEFIFVLPPYNAKQNSSHWAITVKLVCKLLMVHSVMGSGLQFIHNPLYVVISV